MGIFFGGFLGGVLYGRFGTSAVFVMSGALLIVWAVILYRAPTMELLDSLVIQIDADADYCCKTALEKVEGVEEVIIIDGESVAYLKVDKARLDQAALDQIIANR